MWVDTILTVAGCTPTCAGRQATLRGNAVVRAGVGIATVEAASKERFLFLLDQLISLLLQFRRHRSQLID